MRPPIENVLRNPRIQGTGDAVLTAVLAVSSVVPVLGGDPSWGRPKALGVTLGLLSTVPVAWRARRPLTAAAIVLGANAACVFAAAPAAGGVPAVRRADAHRSTRSAGRAEGRRALWMPPVLVVASVPVFVAAVAHGQSRGNIIPSFVWLLAAWATGRDRPQLAPQERGAGAGDRELTEQRSCRRGPRLRSSAAGSPASCTTWSRTTSR